MTTFVEFLAGNAFALAIVAAVALVLVGVFALGDRAPPTVQPTRPISTADGLRATADGPTTDAAATTDDGALGSVAVVGTPTTESPLDAPFTDVDAVAFAVRVASPFGHVTTVRAVTSFRLDVDGETVHVGLPTAHSPVVDDARSTHRRVLHDSNDVPATTADLLTALDTDRSRVARLLSGGVLPGRTRRTYRVTVVPVDRPVAVVGRVSRDGDDWRLDPPEDGALRFLDPSSVTRHA
ncbi:hypothetical protein [Halorubellus sp. PRR65]|uniref:hypothetical protein n=1 Tax=Halorubellus sp. PRR65 TaxID=3098148 RepID=UPI002B26450E|nr:hypothetical protein [Halorubellus sp. PRR65]